MRSWMCYMANIETLVKKDVKSLNAQVIHDDYLLSKNKDFFRLSGVQVFCGRQGMGKTISMVKVLLDIKKRYPKCIVVTNLLLNVDFDYVHFSSMDDLANVLTNVNTGFYGVVYAIDEIHTYFNALDSTNIPRYIFREKSDTLIMCKCIAHKFNIMYVYDGATLVEDFGKLSGDLLKVGFFMQTRKLRDSYDTYQKVVSGREQYESNNNFNFEINKKLLKK